MKSSPRRLGVVSGVEALTSICGGNFLHDFKCICNVLSLCVCSLSLQFYLVRAALNKVLQCSWTEKKIMCFFVEAHLFI